MKAYHGSSDDPAPDCRVPPAVEPLIVRPEYTNVVYDNPKPNSNRGVMPAYSARITHKDGSPRSAAYLIEVTIVDEDALCVRNGGDGARLGRGDLRRVVGNALADRVWQTTAAWHVKMQQYLRIRGCSAPWVVSAVQNINQPVPYRCVSRNSTLSSGSLRTSFLARHSAPHLRECERIQSRLRRRIHTTAVTRIHPH